LNIYPFWSRQSWFQEVHQLSVAHLFLPPPQLFVRSYHPVMVESFVNRKVELWTVVFDCVWRMIYFKRVYWYPLKVTIREFTGRHPKIARTSFCQTPSPTTRIFSAPHPRFFKKWFYRPTLWCVMCQHSYQTVKQVCDYYKEPEDLPRLHRTTRNDSSSKSSPLKCRTK
jgi:hypothetical protein